MTSTVAYFVEQGTRFLNGAAEVTEKICNAGACIPVAGFYFIAAHGGMGALQVTKGVALAVIGFLAEKALECGGCDDELIFSCIVLKETGKEHFKHGCANVVLSTAQFAIGLFTLNLGNLAFPIAFQSFGPFIVQYPQHSAPNMEFPMGFSL